MSRTPLTTAQLAVFLMGKAAQCRCSISDLLTEMDAEGWTWMELDGRRLELNRRSGIWHEVAA